MVSAPTTDFGVSNVKWAWLNNPFLRLAWLDPGAKVGGIMNDERRHLGQGGLKRFGLDCH